MHTLKIRIENKIEIAQYTREFSKLKRLAYKRLEKGLSVVETNNWIKKNVKTFLAVYFIECATLDVKAVLDARKELKIEAPVVWGGKKLLKKRATGKITKEEWREARNGQLYCIGKAGDMHGNRNFKIDFIDKNTIYFCPKRGVKIPIILSQLSKNQQQVLERAELLAKDHKLPLTYRLSKDYLWISIDESRLDLHTEYQKQKGRILSIDSNPEYIGLTICDFDSNNTQNLITKQVFDLSALKGASADKRKHELYEISKQIIKLCRHYQVETVAIEKLETENKNHNKGKRINKLLNNDWKRRVLFNSLKKWCGIYKIQILEIAAAYSSFIGCIINPDETDSIAAALEIGRRANLFNRAFIKKDLPKDTAIVFPVFNPDLTNRWKEELGTKRIRGWKDWFNWFKENPKLSYRILFKDYVEKHNPMLFRFKSRKSKVFLCLN